MMRKLVWTEGLFVTQHHFQQLDRYHESFVSERMRAAMPLDWGVVEVAIDERALANSTLRVSRFVGVLPDGTPLRCEEGKPDAVPPRSFVSEFLPHMAALDVYVALVHEAEGAASVDLDGSSSLVARHLRVQERVADVNTGGAEIPIDCARPLVRVLFGDEVKGAFDAIRIAQIVRGATGAVQLRTSCVPPSLRISASPWLMNGFRNLLALMTARQRSLTAARRQRTAGAVEFEPADAMRFFFIDLLNGSIPVFANLVDAGRAHPEQAYVMLANLIGRLCSFTDGVDPASVQRFDHLDPGTTFEPMFSLAANLLNAVAADRFTEITLQRRDDGVYLGRHPGADILRSDYYLGVSGNFPEQQIRERLPRLMKVASVNHIEAILKSALNGAALELEYRPPASLPLRPGVTFFRLAKTPEFWADITSTGTFALYHPFDPQALKLALYAVESPTSP